eukprot:4843272-Ditylum_brightwellii.AAC.1
MLTSYRSSRISAKAQKEEDPKHEAYKSQAVLSVLRQAVERGGKVGSSIWKTCSFDHDTEKWELEWPEEKT